MNCLDDNVLLVWSCFKATIHFLKLLFDSRKILFRRRLTANNLASNIRRI